MAGAAQDALEQKDVGLLIINNQNSGVKYVG
jgi:hypothetical protein